ncbi:Riboflavin synthase [Caenispirillum salinarum AK4]|uniref:Riboflavin synthase n=1 Tax=Caenispirillum salinarum AK4 TaxID=1238182 RepID=K9H3H4_9PROT|nr:riboflavin synthase [Caenispirillum salinarum]EKV31594.1 Riboflavin synthase [Caenispirillum salinarum AK4]
MFTGIITDLGTVRERKREPGGDTLFTFDTSYDMTTVDIGASIACNGVCLTVIEKGTTGDRGWFTVQASDETLSKTTLGDWDEGRRVNFERALKMGDELGGHVVSGHVDGVARVVDIRGENESRRYVFEVPEGLKKFVAPKGSVTLDGVSLTVNEVEGARFGVNIIPHTQEVTTFGTYKVGDPVNMEIDMLARYVARLLEKD